MNYYFWIFPFFFIYVIGCYIIGKNLQELIKIKNQYLYWGFILSLPIASFLTHSFFLGVIIHALGFFIIKDIIVFIWHKLNLGGETFFKKIYAKGLLIIFLSLIYSIYGYYNAYNLQIKEYNITPLRTLKQKATIVFASDLHLGTINPQYELDFLVNKVNEINPDILILGGDTFDEYTTKKEMSYSIERFKEIKTKYGIYMIEGNHDIFSKHTLELFANSNVNLLEDESILINNNFYLIGRLDIRRNKNSYKRKEYSKLINNLNSNIPIILLEHEPYTKDLKKYSIDLQLTGHTHNGQLFPGNFFVKYGSYKYDNGSQMIVSSGLGVWNIPIRTISNSELLIIHLNT